MEKCEICNNKGYNNSLSNMVLCHKHVLQYRRHGRFIENTRFEQNSYKISECGKYAIIDLRDLKSNIVDKTIIDIEDLEKIIKYRIHRKISNTKDGTKLCYAIAKINNKNIRLHNLICNDFNYDHINNDGLDNRKENLRKINTSQNGMNKRIQSNNYSGVVGVVKNYKSNTWTPQIKKDKKMIRLGVEKLFDKAVEKRLVAESELFKEYSNNYNTKTKTLQLTYLSHDDNKKTYIECDMNGNIINFYKL